MVKVGTNALCESSGRMNVAAVRKLAEQIAEVRRGGVAVTLVASGAIDAPEEKTKAAPKEQATHLQQLLKAKRKAKDRLGDAGDDSKNTGD